MKLGLLVLVLAAPLAAQVVPPDTAITSAAHAAESWLGLMAASQYGASWDQASPYFRAHSTRDAWSAAASHLAVVRTAPRVLLETHWDRSGTPIEEHVLLRWNSKGADNRELGERMVMIRGADEMWRTAVYEQYRSVGGDVIAPEHRGAVPPPAPPRATTTIPKKP